MNTCIVHSVYVYCTTRDIKEITNNVKTLISAECKEFEQESVSIYKLSSSEVRILSRFIRLCLFVYFFVISFLFCFIHFQRVLFSNALSCNSARNGFQM